MYLNFYRGKPHVISRMRNDDSAFCLCFKQYYVNDFFAVFDVCIDNAGSPLTVW